MRNNTGFGLVPIKSEGGPIHPDDPDHGYWGTDESIRKKMMFKYFDVYGVNVEHCKHYDYYDEWYEINTGGLKLEDYGK